MAMIMGTGFPAFRGGLLRYADEIGIGVVVAKIKEFSNNYGQRFEPAELLLKMDQENQIFYNDISEK
jgi:3-hydroxyacyl-CoA dehydrogenase/enoyl-CoA hydratase/3-hydroxybutyryl-CoA epimerase